LKTKTHRYWKQYKLLDFGNGVKVEQFNNIVTIRPETNAINNLSKKLSFWQQKANYIYNSKTVDGGKWNEEKAPEWFINYKSDKVEVKFKLQLSNSKHIGVFPEQAVNWDFITSKIKPNMVKIKQLRGHKKQIKSSNDFLLYLTPDAKKPSILGQTYWANWLQIINTFNDYLQTSQSDNKQLLVFPCCLGL
jgi:hypothetical protein